MHVHVVAVRVCDLADIRQERVIGEVAVQALAGLTDGNRLYEVFATHKAALPGLTDATKGFVAVAPGTDFVEPHFVRPQIAGDFFGDPIIITGQ